MMDHKADVQVGTLLPAMARGAREEGDLVTAELLCAEAMRHFDDGDCFVERWRNFDARLDDETARRPKKAA